MKTSFNGARSFLLLEFRVLAKEKNQGIWASMGPGVFYSWNAALPRQLLLLLD